MTDSFIPLDVKDAMLLCELLLTHRTRELAERRLRNDYDEDCALHGRHLMLGTCYHTYFAWNRLKTVMTSLDGAGARSIRDQWVHDRSLVNQDQVTNEAALQCLWYALADYVVRTCESRAALEAAEAAKGQ